MTVFAVCYFLAFLSGVMCARAFYSRTVTALREKLELHRLLGGNGPRPATFSRRNVRTRAPWQNR